MKSAIAATIFISLTCSAIAAEGGFEAGKQAPAAHEHDSGYKGTKDTRENQVKNLQDLQKGSWVTLEGYIIEKRTGESYIFRDKSGTIKVSIAQPVWRGRTFDSADLIRISGRVQGHDKNVALKVERLDEP